MCIWFTSHACSRGTQSLLLMLQVETKADPRKMMEEDVFCTVD